MRWVGLLCLLLVMPFPGVSSQPAFDDPGELRASDPSGDVELEFSGERQPAPEDSMGDVDLLGVWIANETDDSFEVGLRVRQWEPADGTSRLERSVQFEYGGVTYRATWSPCDDDRTFRLSVRSEASFFTRWLGMACLEGRIDEAAGTMNAVVPKSLVTDADGSPIRFGQSVNGVVAVTRAATNVGMTYYSFNGVNNTAWSGDRAPDTGALGPFRAQMGFNGVGSVFLWSANQVQWSNGESTTLSFEVTLESYEDLDHVIFFSATDVPDGWTVRVPARVEVPAHGVVAFPVILSMGFAHGHGQTRMFNLTGESVVDGEAGTLSLGVHFPLVPQPAGHHNTIYVHTGTAYGCRIWMNAAAQDPDPDADEAAVRACSARGNGSVSQTYWTAGLDPELRIGLDFDVNETGWIQATFVSENEQDVAWLEAWLLYCAPHDEGSGEGSSNCPGGRWIELGHARSDAQAVRANSPVTFEGPVEIRRAADYLPYAGPNRNLQLEIAFATPGGTVASTGVQIVGEDTELVLPLVEFHDAVQQTVGSAANISLEAVDHFEKAVNPGRMAVFRFNATNLAGEYREFSLAIEGHNAGWARWTSGSTISLGPGESRRLALAVEVPSGAVDGERAELFGVVEDTADPSAVAAVRVRASVDTTQEIPDEAGLVPAGDAGANVPAPSMVMSLLVGAAVLQLRIRHRRR